LSIFAIGDLHLSFDERISKPMDIFGSRWENHAERLKQNWEENIGEVDTVLVCGDISWGLRLEEAMADFRWIESLPGRKIITKGNHDLWWGSVKKLNSISENIRFLQNDAVLIFDEDRRICICGTRGWICPGTEGFDEHDEKIFKRELIRLEMSLKEAKKQEPDLIIAMLHYPPCNDKFQPSEFTNMLSRYGVKTCIYGHLHGKDAFKNGFQGILNGVEYKLVSLDYIEANPIKIL
jgi:hypothetical protein